MLNPIFGLFTAFVVSYALLPFIIRFSKKKKLGARPGHRRIHKAIKPSLGGVAIFLGFTLSCLLWTRDPASSLIFLLMPILIIPFIIGLLDDLVDLKPLAKLLAQWITASLLFFMLDIRLTSFYGLIDAGEFPFILSYIITVSAIVIITNALNLIDGIDGLAAAFSLVACAAFGSWYLTLNEYQFALVCFALAGGILAFLFQNWEPSKIFMGDTGSMVIGTLLSIVMIHFINNNDRLSDSHPFRFNSSIGTAICVMIIPIIDTVRIIITRLSKGISPFAADKRHIHHGLIRLGFSHQTAVYILTFVHVCMIGIAIAFRNVNENILLIAIVATSVSLCLWLDYALNKRLHGNGQASHSRPVE